MKKISLIDFQRLSGLSDRALMHLLKSTQLKCSTEQGQILIDIEQLSVKKLVEAVSHKSAQLLLKDQNYLSERIASTLTTKLESIFDQALSIAAGRKS